MEGIQRTGAWRGCRGLVRGGAAGKWELSSLGLWDPLLLLLTGTS